VVTQVPSGELTSVEQSLVEHVGRGEWLDLAADDEAVDEAAMRSWGDSRTCRATVIRDILRGRLAADPDPHGLRLRGARISGLLDLKNLTTDVNLELSDCFLEEGMVARGARLASVALTGSWLEHPAEPPLNADRLTCSVLDLTGATIIGHAEAGSVNLRGAHIGDILGGDWATLRNDSGPALAADGLEVRGLGMFLRGLTATGVGKDGAIRLHGAHIAANLEYDGASLHNDCGPALVGDSLQVGQAIYLRDGFSATSASEGGAVSLYEAHIGGSLDCSGAALRNDCGPALVADGLQVGHAIFLRELTATGADEGGAVRLTGADIGGQLDCTNASLRNDSGSALVAYGVQVGQGMFLRHGFTATGGGTGVALNLMGARVSGTLDFDPARLEHPADPHSRLTVDGLTYTGVPHLISAQEWLDLLRQGTPGYAAQPYQQLAAGYRALGDERQWRRILMAQRDDQLARALPRPRWTERLWGKITKVTLGYGYQPWRALLFLIGVVVLSCVLAVVLGSHGALAQTSNTATPGRPCTVIQQVSVGLDLNLPVGSVARPDCDLTTDPASATAAWLTAAGWVLRLLAWVFAALFIAGFTSAVRKT
jgi:hypothetical protein